MRKLAVLCLLVACGKSTTIVNHDPHSPEIVGLQRLGDGPYQPGSTEHFRVIYSVDEAAGLHWTPSAGPIVTSGDEVAWTRPAADEASLTVALETKTRVSTSTFRFRLSSNGALAASPAGTVDGTGNATGNTCRLAFDGSGNPVMIYRNDTHPAVWYAKWNGASWQTELVDGMGYEVGGAVDWQMALALAADGTPHVAYTLENGQVWYATRTAGGWTREHVDGTISRQQDRYGYVNLALDASRSNRPTIFYYNGSSAIAATRATGWTNTSLGGAWYLGGLAMSGGVAYFSMYYGGYRVGSWNGTDAAYVATASVVGANPAYEVPMAVALDSSSRPLMQTTNTLVHVKPGTGLADATLTVSPFEEPTTTVQDLTYAAGKPYMAVNEGTNLVFITTDANGYWVYTTAGSLDAASGMRIGVAVDPAGVAHACFRRNGVITYQ
ncbi:MAG: hypothetical protein ACXWLM_05445 [Myxococcales bacterium]